MRAMGPASAIGGASMNVRLSRGGMGSIIIQALNRFFALMVGILLARGLGVDGYGVYAFSLSIMGILLVGATAGMPTLLLREVAASCNLSEWGRLRGVLMFSGRVVLISSVFFSAIGIITVYILRGDLYEKEALVYCVMLAMLPIYALLSTTTSAISGLHRVNLGQSIQMLLLPGMVFVVVGTLFWLFPQLKYPEYALIGQCVAALLVLVAGLATLYRVAPKQIFGDIKQTYRSDWAKSSFPFVLSGGAWVINSQADLLMLGWIGCPADVGSYNVAVRMSALVVFGATAINAVVTPYFASAYAANDNEAIQKLVNTATRVGLFLALPLGAVFIVFGESILGLTFGEEYKAGYAPMAVIVVGKLFNAGFGWAGIILNMTGHEGEVAKAMGWATIVNIVLNAALIPEYGTVGAAVASCITLGIWNIRLLFLSKKYFSIKLNPFVLKRRA